MFDLSQFTDNFHFLRPLWFFALFPVSLLLLFIVKSKITNRHLSRYVNTDFLSVLAVTKQGASRKLELALLGTFLTVSIFCLAGPTWEKVSAPVSKSQSATVIVWDLSLSMLADDIKPSRLVRARRKLTDMLNLKKDGLTALIVYSGDAHIVTPLSDDVNTIKSMLKTMSPEIMPAKGSNIEEAFRIAHDLLAKSNSKDGHIVIFTDGISDSAREELATIQRSKLSEVVIWSIGTREGSPIPLNDGSFLRDGRGEIVVARLDENSLVDTASSIGASYIPFSHSDLDVNTIERRIFGKTSSLSEDENDTKTFDDWEEHGRFLLLPLALLFSLLFRRGWALPMLAIGFISLPNSDAQALELPNILKSQNQEAQSAYDAGDSETAAALFEDKEWKAAANYKSKNYAESESYYRQQDSDSALFNLGNSLAKQGKYKEAIKAYEQALENNKRHSGAETNLALIKKLLEQKQSEQNQQQGQSGGDGNKEDEAQNQGEKQSGENEQGSNASASKSNSDSENQSGDSGREQNTEKNGDASEQNDSQNATSNQNETDQQGDEKNAQNSGNQTPADKQLSDDEQETLDKHYKDPADNHENDQPGTSTKDSQPTTETKEQQKATNQPDDSDEAPKPYETQASLPEAIEEGLSEEDQAFEQWLRKIPDDPGQLMRNKFLHEYRQKQLEYRSGALRPPPSDEERW